MACPFFLPQAALKDFSELYMGTCAAEEGAAVASEMIEGCNRGYARERCHRAAQSESDAFRFLVKSQANGIVQIAWSSERDHHPIAVGSLPMSRSEVAESALQQQARMAAIEYLDHIGA